MKDWIEIKFWRVAIYLIQKGYGDGCEDYAEDCAACEAHEVELWIRNHIKLIELW